MVRDLGLRNFEIGCRCCFFRNLKRLSALLYHIIMHNRNRRKSSLNYATINGAVGILYPLINGAALGAGGKNRRWHHCWFHEFDTWCCRARRKAAISTRGRTGPGPAPAIELAWARSR